MSIVKIEVNNLAAYTLKVLLVIVSGYFLFSAYTDSSNEYIVRRGIKYTLENDARSFFINLMKDLSIGLFCLYYAIFGIIAKEKQ